METKIPKAEVRKGRIRLIVIFAMFAIPTLSVLWMFAGDQIWRPEGTVNNGTLVVPARPLPNADGVISINEEAIESDFLKGRWTLVYIGTTDCPDLCKEVLHRITQIHLSMGEKTQRVQRLYLAVGDQPQALLPLLDENKGLVVGVLDDNNELLQSFILGQPTITGLNRVYMVDPLGNLMMYYEPDQEPNGILRDLRRLLKWSQIG